MTLQVHVWALFTITVNILSPLCLSWESFHCANVSRPREAFISSSHWQIQDTKKETLKRGNVNFSHLRSCCSAANSHILHTNKERSQNTLCSQPQHWLWNFHRQQIAHGDGSAFSSKFQVSAKWFSNHLKDVLCNRLHLIDKLYSLLVSFQLEWQV